MNKAPTRIQLKRTKGWRMPANTLKVARPSDLGNIFVVGPETHCTCRTAVCPHTQFSVSSPEEAVELYRQNVVHGFRTLGRLPDLVGYNLGCWCPLDQPCHADVLLEFALTVERYPKAEHFKADEVQIINHNSYSLMAKLFDQTVLLPSNRCVVHTDNSVSVPEWLTTIKGVIPF